MGKIRNTKRVWRLFQRHQADTWCQTPQTIHLSAAKHFFLIPREQYLVMGVPVTPSVSLHLSYSTVHSLFQHILNNLISNSLFLTRFIFHYAVYLLTGIFFDTALKPGNILQQLCIHFQKEWSCFPPKSLKARSLDNEDLFLQVKKYRY